MINITLALDRRSTNVLFQDAMFLLHSDLWLLSLAKYHYNEQGYDALHYSTLVR